MTLEEAEVLMNRYPDATVQEIAGIFSKINQKRQLSDHPRGGVEFLFGPNVPEREREDEFEVTVLRTPVERRQCGAGHAHVSFQLSKSYSACVSTCRM